MMEKNELLDILRQYQTDSQFLNDDLADQIIAYINSGAPIDQAINKALQGNDYFAALIPLMTSSIALATCRGYGIKNPSQAQQVAVMKALQDKPWTSDDVSLKERLQGMKKNIRQSIKNSIAGAKSKIKRMEQGVNEMLGFLRVPKKVQQELREASKPNIFQAAQNPIKAVSSDPSIQSKLPERAILAEKPKESDKPKEANKPKDPDKSKEASAPPKILLVEQAAEIKKRPEPKKQESIKSVEKEKNSELPPKEKPKYIEPLPSPKDLAHELPLYLRRLELAARGLSGGNPQFLVTYEATLKAVEREMKKFVERHKQGAPNQNLRGDYDLVIRAAQKLATQSSRYAWEALNRQIEYAIKSRVAYFSERIARTEAARAWFDGFLAKYQDDETVVAYRWKLSSRHHLLPYDQCDVCANMNVGLGKGIYPKTKLPSIPRHPHCMCMLVQIYADEVDKDAVFNPDKAREYIDSLKIGDQLALFGKEGLLKYQQSGDWEGLMRGWDGFREPKSRLKKEDFKQEAILPNHERSMISRDKIFKYALDANSPSGKDKAVVFESALGYNQSNGDHLIKSIMGQVKNFARTDRPSDEYGDRYNVVMAIKGPNGKTANVLTAWMVRKGEDFPRLTTLYVTDKEASEIGDS